MADPDVGDKAPGFQLPNQASDHVSLSDFAGQPLVLFFYPGDFTPICTREACSFRDSFGEFEAMDAAVVGISQDEPAKHAKFADEYDLSFDLLSDVDGTVTEDYGVDGLLGVQRVTFVVDGDGVICERIRSPLPGPHVKKALAAIEGMSVA